MSAFAALLALVLPLQADAGAARLLDPQRSQVDFEVRALWVRRVRGQFDTVLGQVEPQPDPDWARVDVQVPVDSLSMGNPDHAAWARSAAFFDAARHPWIHFRSDPFPLTLLERGGLLPGVLELHGHRREVQFSLLPGTCTRPGLDCPVLAEGEVSRADFGMDAHRVTVGDRVLLRLRMQVAAPAGEGA